MSLDEPAPRSCPLDRARSIGSARPVDVPAVLHAVDEHDRRVIIDFVDDAVVTPACRPQARELPHERLSDPTRGDREAAQDELQGSTAHLLGESTEVSEPLGRDLRLVRQRLLHVIPETQALPLRRLSL